MPVFEGAVDRLPTTSTPSPWSTKPAKYRMTDDGVVKGRGENSTSSSVRAAPPDDHLGGAGKGPDSRRERKSSEILGMYEVLEYVTGAVSFASTEWRGG